jgi:hypothetical protein
MSAMKPSYARSRRAQLLVAVADGEEIGQALVGGLGAARPPHVPGECLPRVALLKGALHCCGVLGNALGEDRGHQVVAGGEVPVQRAAADAGGLAALRAAPPG